MNISRETVIRPRLLDRELPDLWRGAYEVLAGQMVDTASVRADLGD